MIVFSLAFSNFLSFGASAAFTEYGFGHLPLVLESGGYLHSLVLDGTKMGNIVYEVSGPVSFTGTIEAEFPAMAANGPRSIIAGTKFGILRLYVFDGHSLSSRVVDERASDPAILVRGGMPVLIYRSPISGAVRYLVLDWDGSVLEEGVLGFEHGAVSRPLMDSGMVLYRIPTRGGIWSKLYDYPAGLVSSSFSARSPESGGPGVSNGVAEWTFMVYLDGDNNLDSYGYWDIQEMVSGYQDGAEPHVHVIVLYDKSSSGDSHLYNVTDDGMEEISGDADWWPVTGEVNMGDPQTLVDFVTWTIQNYPAEHYALDLWDHGGDYSGCCWDDTNNDHLSVEELREALSQIYGNTGVMLDFYGYDACIMGYVGIHYQTKDFVLFSAGSQDTEGGDGWDYTALVSGLTADPSMDAEGWASYFIQHVDDEHNGGSIETMGVTNTSRFEFLVNALNWMAQKLRHVAGAQHSSISQAFSGSVHFYGNPDLGSLAEEIAQDVDDTEVQEAANQVSYYVQYSFMAWHAPGVEHTGVGIMDSTTSYSGHTSIPFVEEVNWYSFLQYYEQWQDAPNTEPEVEISQPSEGDVFQQGSTITVQGTASDDDTVSLVQVKVDTQPWQDATGTDSWSYEIDTSSLPIGQHTIWARSYDGFDYSYYAWVNVTVVMNTDLPDLEVDPANVTFSPSDPEEGDVVTVTALVQNIGNVDSPSFQVALLLDGEEVDRVSAGPLTVGGSQSVQLSLDTTGHVGEHTVTVVLDPENEVQELSESNNRADKSLVVSGYQPVVVAQLGQEYGWPNATVTVPFIVRNNGTYTDTIALQGACDWDFTLRVNSLTLGPGEEAVVQVDVVVPEGGGTTSLTLTAHSQGSGKEDSATVSLSSNYMEDSFGYRMAYSYYLDLGSLDWEDLGLGDDDTAYLALPFEFPFYGQLLDGLYVSSNGFVSTGDHAYPDNQGLPFGADSLIAPFWDDLDPGQGSVSRAFTDLGGVDAVVIRWNAPPKGSSDPLTFYLVLTEEGRMLFLYEDAVSGGGHSMGSSATVGIQNGDGSGGMYIEFSHDDAVLASGSCVEASMRPGAPSNPIIEGPGSAGVYEDVEFTFTSMDPEGDPIRFHVDWGDGTHQVTDFVTSEAVLHHMFLEEGTLTVTAFAEDPEGHQSGTSSFTVDVSTGPVVRILSPQNNSEVSGVLDVYGLALEPGTGDLQQVWMQEFGAARYEGPQVVGDVDGDGLNEVLMGGRDALLRVYRWQNGTFELLATIQSGYGDNPGGFAIGDVDGDGFNEIAVAWDYHFQLWRWENGSFVQMGDTWDGDGTDDTYDVFLGDVDMDGIPEIVLADHPHSGGPEITVLKWSDGGIHEIASWNMPGGNFMTPMAWVADVDDDGVNEIVATPGDDVVVLELNGGSFQWSYVARDLPSLAYGCVAADTDMDGVPEIHVGLDSPDAYIYGWNGSGYELEAHFHWDGEGVVIEGVSAGDVDGDGVPEAVFGTDVVHVVRWFGGGYAEIMDFGQPGIGDIAPLNVGDFDNDLHNEILVGNVIADPQGRYTMRLLTYQDVIQRVEVRVDNGPWEDADGTNDWSYFLNTYDLENGLHVIRARSYDGTVYSQYDVITIVVNNQPDEEPPTVQITDPQEGAYVNSSSVTVRWTGSDNVGIEYYEISVDSLPFSSVGQAEEYTIEGLGDGGHTVRVRAHDYAGNIAIAWVNFTVDTSKPMARILEPSDDSLVAGPNVTVRFEVDDNVGVAEVWLSVDGESWIRVSGDSYTIYGMEDGHHMVTLRVLDLAGNANEDTVEFDVDSMPPNLELETPGEGEVLGETPVTASWTFGDNYGVDHVEYSVDGSDWVDAGLSTQVQLSLPEGLHVLRVRAIDLVGLSTEASVRFYVDLTPPEVSITEPEEGAVISSTDVRVAWMASDEHLSGVFLSLDGEEPYPVTGNSAWLHDLRPGNHTVTVIAEDEAGHSSEASVHFAVDPSLPWVRITSPENGTIVPTMEVNVRWEANFAYLDHFVVYLDGEEVATTTGDNVTLSGLAEGQHTVSVVEVTTNGRSAGDEVTFVLDYNPPSAQILSPTDGSYLNGLVELIWAVQDATLNGTWIVIDGSERIPVQPSGNLTLELPEGVHEIAILAVDALGREASASISVTVDLTPPTLEVEEPVEGSLYSANVTLAWEAGDNFGLETVSYRLDGGRWNDLGASGRICIEVGESGWHTIEFKAKDHAGNEVLVVRHFAVDADPPLLTLNSPSQGAFYNRTVIEVEVSVEETHSFVVRYSVDGGDLVVGGTHFTIGGLGEGPHVLYVEVEDEVGNVASVSVEFHIDVTPPEISDVQYPAVTSDGVVPVRLTVEEENLWQVQYRVDGGSWVNVGTNLSFTILLQEPGNHGIDVIVRDKAGNCASASFGILYDSGPPTVTLLTEDFLYPTGSVEISFRATDDYSLDRAVLVMDNRTWEMDLSGSEADGAFHVAMPDGNYSAEIIVYDVAGNSASVEVEVTVDTMPPVIEVESPSMGSTYGREVPLHYRVEDLTAVEVTVLLDGEVWDGSLSNLSHGAHVLTIEAVDRAGHSSSVSVSFSVDARGPIIDALILEAGHGRVVILLHVSDPSGVGTVEYSVDGGSWVIVQPGRLEIEVGSGDHVIQFRAYDCLGNGASTEMEVHVPGTWTYAVLGAAIPLIILAIVVVLRRK